MGTPDDVKSVWAFAGGSPPQHVRVVMREPRPAPCNGQCPWLAANHGQTRQLFYDHEVPGIELPDDGIYSFSPWKRAQVWAEDLRDGITGYGSLCHVRGQGTKQRGDGAVDVVSCQCTGALVMQQREVLRHVSRGESALTTQGAARVASDMLGREISESDLVDIDLADLLAHAHPSLLDPKIGSDAVAPPLSKREVREWKRLSGQPRKKVRGAGRAGVRG
jgi:hypothetical protein